MGRTGSTSERGVKKGEIHTHEPSSGDSLSRFCIMNIAGGWAWTTANSIPVNRL